MDRNRFVRVAAIAGGIIVCAARTSTAADPVSDWNTIAGQSTVTAGQNGIVASRTLAMAQIAVHDALNAIDSRYERYASWGTAPAGASVEAAVAAAARDALVGAIAVGPLPFVGFGNPTLQGNAVARVNAACDGAQPMRQLLQERRRGGRSSGSCGDYRPAKHRSCNRSSHTYPARGPATGSKHRTRFRQSSHAGGPLAAVLLGWGQYSVRPAP
jgi:hypothetical protein